MNTWRWQISLNTVIFVAVKIQTEKNTKKQNVGQICKLHSSHIKQTVKYLHSV